MAELVKPHVRIVELQHAIETWEAMLRICVNRREWHGVMDAAADLREFEAELLGIKSSKTDSEGLTAPLDPGEGCSPVRASIVEEP